MRDLLAHADLAKYAGQFVWLELSYDEPRNRKFLLRYGATATPTFFVIDPQEETVAAMQPGGMSLTELKQFLDRGAVVVLAKRKAPADAALQSGDKLIARRPAEAAKAYEQALQLAPTDWIRRELAEASLVEALKDSEQWQECARTASDEAASMKRDALFVRTLVAGMWCLASTDSAPWVDLQLTAIQPLAEEALSLPITVRDHRDSIYRTLMYVEVKRKREDAALKWGDRWLAELDAATPQSDDERSALDIARVENLQIVGDPVRILPALEASEKAMPNNYIASLRLAQIELAANQFHEAIAASDRGLTRGPGAVGQAWLLKIKAQALQALGRRQEAQSTLQDAARAAEQIPSQESRVRNLASIRKLLAQTPEPAK
jgi:tetratricopeptide (TPR) repeat protein